MSAGEFAGTLKERVTIQRMDDARDAAGEAGGAWLTLGTAPASVEPAGTGPIEIGEALAAEPLWRVRMRPRDVAVGDRLAWRGRLLGVRAVTADPVTPDRIELGCEEERP